MITPEYPPKCGGIGWYVYYLSREIASRGYRITIFVRSPHPLKPFGPFRITTINAGIFPLLNAFKLTREARKYLAADPHDIAIVHSTPVGAWLHDIPTILVSHCCIAEGQKTLYRGAYDIKSVLHIIFGKLYCLAEKKSILEANAVAAVSNSMKEEILIHYGKSPTYVGNAVDTTVFYPSDRPQKRGVLLPSMLRAGKGVRQALRVIQRVRRQECDIPFKFIGDGPMKEWLVKAYTRMFMQDFG